MTDEPKDLMEEQTTTRLRPNFSLQPTNPSVWQSLEWIDTDVEVIATFIKEGDISLSTRKVLATLPPTSTNKNLFNDDIFQHHRVNVGSCRQWSKHLVAESRRPATVSAAPVSSDGCFNIQIHPLTVDLEEVPLDKKLTEVENTKVEIKHVTMEEFSHEAEHLEELESLHTKQQNNIQNDKLQDFDDLAAPPGEVDEEVEVKPKERSIRRKFLNWLDHLAHDYCSKKIERTYQRELEEGDQHYPTNFYFFYPMTRAMRERQKRRRWLRCDNQRQNVKNCVDAYWLEKRKNKEALRIQEEERYEKWATAHEVSDSDSPPNEPKRRMSKWEKRFLRAKEIYSTQLLP